jgi:zinc protease
MGYNVPVFNTAKEKWEPYALEALARILDMGESSRFAKKLVRKQQILAAHDASYNPYSRLATLFTLSAIPTQSHTLNDAKQAMLNEIKTLQTSLVSKQELERIKAQMTADKIYSKDSISYQASEIGSAETVGVTWKEADQFLQRIEAVTAQQVQTVAKKYLIEDRLTITKLNPLPMTANTPSTPLPKMESQNVH